MSLTTPTTHGDATALALLVEQRWTPQHTARHLGVPYSAVEALIRECGGERGLPHALAQARKGHNPRALATEGAVQVVARVVSLPTAQVHAHPRNIRADLGDLTELAASIQACGILNPLRVFQEAPERFVVVDGHRRLSAARDTGISTVPCLVTPKPAPDATVETMLASAMHKELGPLDQAEAFARLITMGVLQADIAQRTGHRPHFVRDRLALLNLPKQVQTRLRDGQVTVGAAIDLARKINTTGTGSAPITAPRSQYLTKGHPLAAQVTEACTHRDTRTVIGGVGCGQCWERIVAATVLDQAAADAVERDTSLWLAGLANAHRADRAR